MAFTREDMARRVKLMLTVAAAAGAVLIAVLWVVFWVKLSALTGRRGEEWPATWLTFAILATVGVPIFLLTWSRNLHLLRNGAEVPGRVVSVSPLAHSGSRPVTYTYVVDGVEHTVKRDTPQVYADEYRPGAAVRVLVDPKNPKRAMILN